MTAPEIVTEEHSATVTLLLERAEKKGDLPIYNASLNKVRSISANPDSHAMELAQTIMKDANLSVKLLRIANSPFYNRGMGKIASVSRAVILLGFDSIKNLCLTLKLIESFTDDHPEVALNKMVAHSYLTAGFVRDLAIKCNPKEAEESYISGLTHNLGEISVGYFAPQTYLELLNLFKNENMSWIQAQERILGESFASIGQQLAKNWNFSHKVINCMSDYNPETKGIVKNQEQLNHAIVSLGSQIIGSLYQERQQIKTPINKLMAQLSNATGIKLDHIEKSLANSFHRSCDLTKEYGLNPRLLQPSIHDTKDSSRDKLARELSFILTDQDQTNTEIEKDSVPFLKVINETNLTPHSHILAENTNNTSNKTVHKKSKPQLEIKQNISNTTKPKLHGDPNLQLAIIQEITTMVSEQASLNKLFVKILEGLHNGVGFDNAMLCLLSPNRKTYAGRIVLGNNSQTLQQTISGKFDPTNDIFSRILSEGSDLVVDDCNDSNWNNVLNANFSEKSNCQSFIIAGIKSRAKPLGFFYVDNSETKLAFTPEMKRGFTQFIAQARLSVQICN
ncbi:hypothetical protein MNBD_GAMMA16-2290 [hydrothermal vent metagenome]|uniref:HDOD domain-containing protein n=1 Tax=hydrothermal vent metagenome TaxID=652676 RepID=A0A3B0ZYE8_9ZZZZ